MHTDEKHDGRTFEVTLLWVDEDGETHVSVDYPDRDHEEKLHVSDIRVAADEGRIERTNTAHEAHERRQTNE